MTAGSTSAFLNVVQFFYLSARYNACTVLSNDVTILARKSRLPLISGGLYVLVGAVAVKKPTAVTWT